jgi:phosphoserine phosphatase
MAMNGNVALMDWDNTIRSGWTIRDWAGHLKNNGLIPAHTPVEVEAGIERYATGTWTYARMAEAVLEALASGLKGQSSKLVAAQALIFVRADSRLFPFAKSLLSALAARGMSLVVISGAPQEVLDAAASYYGLSEVHGTTFDIRNGTYVGTVSENRATKAGKHEAATILLGKSRAFVAIGDSEADLPLLEKARLSVIVGDRKFARTVPNSFFLQPDDTDISSILQAIDAC